MWYRLNCAQKCEEHVCRCGRATFATRARALSPPHPNEYLSHTNVNSANPSGTATKRAETDNDFVAANTVRTCKTYKNAAVYNEHDILSTVTVCPSMPANLSDVENAHDYHKPAGLGGLCSESLHFTWPPPRPNLAQTRRTFNPTMSKTNVKPAAPSASGKL